MQLDSNVMIQQSYKAVNSLNLLKKKPRERKSMAITLFGLERKNGISNPKVIITA